MNLTYSFFIGGDGLVQQEPVRLEIFLTKLAFLFWGKSVYKAFADWLPLAGDEQVLDFGCGMGTVAYYAAKRLTRGNLTCLDVSQRWLKACRKTLRKYENVTFLHADAPALAEKSFDVVYCHFVLHDIADSEMETVITALAESLKSGGHLIFREPLYEAKKITMIKELISRSQLILKGSRITDVPLMGNVLESIYIK